MPMSLALSVLSAVTSRQHRLPCSCRFDVCQEDDGEDGGSENPPRAEEDDLRGDRRS